MLIGLLKIILKIPSDSGARALVIATKILDLLTTGLDMLLTREVITSYINPDLVLVIIGMILRRAVEEIQWNDRYTSRMEQNKYKGFVGLPQQFMVLTTIMITAYTEAMRLCKSGWWWCSKNHPLDPYPPKKGKVRRQDKKPKCKQNPLTTLLGLYAAGIITSQIPVFHFASAGTVGMRKHFYKYSDMKGFLNTMKLNSGGKQHGPTTTHSSKATTRTLN